MSKKNETLKLNVKSIKESVVTSHQPDMDDALVTQHVVDALENRNRNTSIDGTLVITNPKTQSVKVMNFGLTNGSSYANSSTVKCHTEDDSVQLRAALRSDFGIRTYNDGEFGGDPALHTMTRGFDVFAKEIVKIVVTPKEEKEDE